MNTRKNIKFLDTALGRIIAGKTLFTKSHPLGGIPLEAEFLRCILYSAGDKAIDVGSNTCCIKVSVPEALSARNFILINSLLMLDLNAKLPLDEKTKIAGAINSLADQSLSLDSWLQTLDIFRMLFDTADYKTLRSAGFNATSDIFSMAIRFRESQSSISSILQSEDPDSESETDRQNFYWTNFPSSFSYIWDVHGWAFGPVQSRVLMVNRSANGKRLPPSSWTIGYGHALNGFINLVNIIKNQEFQSEFFRNLLGQSLRTTWEDINFQLKNYATFNGREWVPTGVPADLNSLLKKALLSPSLLDSNKQSKEKSDFVENIDIWRRRYHWIANITFVLQCLGGTRIARVFGNLGGSRTPLPDSLPLALTEASSKTDLEQLRSTSGAKRIVLWNRDKKQAVAMPAFESFSKSSLKFGETTFPFYFMGNSANNRLIRLKDSSNRLDEFLRDFVSKVLTLQVKSKSLVSIYRSTFQALSENNIVMYISQGSSLKEPTSDEDWLKSFISLQVWLGGLAFYLDHPKYAQEQKKIRPFLDVISNSLLTLLDHLCVYGLNDNTKNLALGRSAGQVANLIVPYISFDQKKPVGMSADSPLLSAPAIDALARVFLEFNVGLAVATSVNASSTTNWFSLIRGKKTIPRRTFVMLIKKMARAMPTIPMSDPVLLSINYQQQLASVLTSAAGNAGLSDHFSILDGSSALNSIIINVQLSNFIRAIVGSYSKFGQVSASYLESFLLGPTN